MPIQNQLRGMSSGMEHYKRCANYRTHDMFGDGTQPLSENQNFTFCHATYVLNATQKNITYPRVAVAPTVSRKSEAQTKVVSVCPTARLKSPRSPSCARTDTDRADSAR